IVREPIQLLALHLAAAATGDSAYVQLQVHTLVAARQISDASSSLIVIAPMPSAAHATCCFFRRRVSLMTTAMWSVNTPLTAAPGTNPGNRYASRNSRRRLIFDMR